MASNYYNPYKWVNRSVSGRNNYPAVGGRYKYIRPHVSNESTSSITALTEFVHTPTSKGVTTHKLDTKQMGNANHNHDLHTRKDSAKSVSTPKRKALYTHRPNGCSNVVFLAQKTLYKYVRPKHGHEGVKMNPNSSPWYLRSSAFYSSRLWRDQHQYKYVRKSIGKSTPKSCIKIVSKFKIRKISVRVSNAFPPSIDQYRYRKYRQSLRRAVRHLKYRRKSICKSFSKTGVCRKRACRFAHDPDYVRICPKFLQQRCPLGTDACHLSHVLDPCRLVQCEFYKNGNCDRPQCPYLHVTYAPDVPVCRNFTCGRCPRGRLCQRRHVYPDKCKRSIPRKRKVNCTNSKPRRLSKRKRTSATAAFPSLPQGSLRNIHPAPQFIPLLQGKDKT